MLVLEEMVRMLVLQYGHRDVEDGLFHRHQQTIATTVVGRLLWE